MEEGATAIDPTANPAENVKLDENGNPILEEQLPPNITEEVYQDMKNIWSVFDDGGKGEVTVDELPTIMRALDINVAAEGALQEIQSSIDPEGKGYFTFEMLTKVMNDKLKETDTIEDLLAQLKKLDRDGDGKIPSPEFKQYMKTMGSKMNDEELDELMKEADPKNEGTVDIEEFAERICPPKK